MNKDSPPSLSALNFFCAYSHQQYQQFQAQLIKLGEYDRRRQIEQSLVPEANEFSVPGYCYITSRFTEFTVAWDRANARGQHKMPRWRETLLSDRIYNNRMRASMHLFELMLRPRREDLIYIAEQRSPLYAWLKEKYPNSIGSEYLGPSTPAGKIDEHGVRSESLTELSFSDESKQFVLAFECLEHIPDYKAALKECARVLMPGGSLVITVPFRRDLPHNLVRAKVGKDNNVEHLLPPEYHGDPLRKEGCLCYYHFGWELLDDMSAVGFRDPRAILYWSRDFGYLGIEQILFCADK